MQVGATGRDRGRLDRHAEPEGRELRQRHRGSRFVAAASSPTPRTALIRRSEVSVVSVISTAE
jgi:hypothetical protein